MTQSIVLSGMGGDTLHQRIREGLVAVRPAVMGVASAFVSVQGMQRAIELRKRCRAGEARIVMGIDNEITHPNAIMVALRAGWGVRIGRSPAGIFHPKLIVAGKGFSEAGEVMEPSFNYIGSGNLGIRGLEKNTECSIIARGDGCIPGAGDVFRQIWAGADDVTEDLLRDYSKQFAEQSRRRGTRELAALGVIDEEPAEGGAPGRRNKTIRKYPAVDHAYATAVWVGLESFTGDRRFQPEFPRAAREVLLRIIGGSAGALDARFADGVVRQVTYDYYPNNGMFRLNIPNDAPGVAEARNTRTGLVLFERGEGEPTFRLRILPPGAEANEIIGRSVALGSWGQTRTRFYGWF